MDFAARAHAALSGRHDPSWASGSFQSKPFILLRYFIAGAAFGALATAQEDSNRAASTAIALERRGIHAAKG
ncbi:hypothetical protein M2232_000950 [Bradyrhizobium japonicum]|uniref:hypothetical protein n=1 Tax=Bradyrhizobium japonicum TaxID=375 RepID=UPI001269D8DD|nr:hypothetical protein [Bradyrhizobium japonicum]MCW2217418.1 hypothetical protein [Bradyrhizobium japonicum]MCW2342032.1 hypothetical protein [Bradyrhizobium japonicum]